MVETVIQATHLHKRYGTQTAVHDISFSVQRGEIFGILGPNGAGKTTAVEIVMGLRTPDSGQAQVLGLDPQQQNKTLRQRIGIQLQQASLPSDIKVWEALDLFASFYERAVNWQKLIDDWGLREKQATAFDKLSGGQKQRLFIALALLNDPEVVFLDELTTGLDPQARRHTWKLVQAIREQGKTVVLVTHFMDEAEQLCDRVAIVENGRIIALDTPQALIQQTQGEPCIQFTAPHGFDPASLRAISQVSRVEQNGRELTIYGNGPLLARVATYLAEQNITPTDLRTQQTTLEDVFLRLTGKALRD
jgi:ABC-2 type transport system ATP-binding protein